MNGRGEGLLNCETPGCFAWRPNFTFGSSVGPAQAKYVVSEHRTSTGSVDAWRQIQHICWVRCDVLSHRIADNVDILLWPRTISPLNAPSI